jgi:hypothetical protein
VWGGETLGRSNIPVIGNIQQTPREERREPFTEICQKKEDYIACRNLRVRATVLLFPRGLTFLLTIDYYGRSGG